MIVFWLGAAGFIVSLSLIERHRRRRLIRRMAAGQTQPGENGGVADVYGPNVAAASTYSNMRGRG